MKLPSSIAGYNALLWHNDSAMMSQEYVIVVHAKDVDVRMMKMGLTS